jgi:hypothetical protein
MPVTKLAECLISVFFCSTADNSASPIQHDMRHQAIGRVLDTLFLVRRLNHGSIGDYGGYERSNGWFHDMRVSAKSGIQFRREDLRWVTAATICRLPYLAGLRRAQTTSTTGPSDCIRDLAGLRGCPGWDQTKLELITSFDWWYARSQPLLLLIKVY